ncbi:MULTISPECIES: N-acetylmuramoyl-L-alanine amidase [Ureibacillus]|uniref:N-acetylmuramoyl-L-alanine amidase n=1 Tax=Ureibacillus thermosphaericus TaxID=51173 RepID=A0A840PSX0_URETH|nr:N-acetylmuramoyl-L-alanine amidase [Ureibacillus thermosphaericus]MBB5149073.1 N-acetylmuramoyl-L-alanine amidase [Ureibacillus thermosphaericus]NKZ31837.1 SH3 domain-containing protein [Ureibacillus thermosphaericus]
MSLKKISLLIGFILCLSLFNIHTTSAKVQFVDVPPSYDAYEEIQYLINLGAIKGYETENGTYYKPHQPVTRGQAAKMVVISSGLQPLKVKQSSFKDVQTGTELSGYVERAVKEGYFSAFKNGEFGPYVNLTRQEMAKVLATAFQLDVEKYANLTVPFKDISPKHPYYKYISAIYYNGITKGSPSGKERVFMPESSVTRGQFASFIARAKEEKYRLELPVQGVQVPNEKDAIGTVAATVDYLNVRTSTDTSTNANRIGQINKGTKLPLFEIQPGWFKVMYKDQYAYISRDYAQVVDEAGQPLGKVQKHVIAVGKVNVYKSSNTNSKVIGSFNADEQIPVYKTVGDWYLTEKDGVPGYVQASATKQPVVEKPVDPPVKDPVETPPVKDPVDKDPVVETPTYTTNTIGRVTTNALNIREKADATSNSLGTLNKGEIVAVHSISGNWANITTKNGTKGYVHKTYLKLINQKGSPVKDRVIIIDAGHGGKDPGAASNGAVEKEITLKVATVVKNRLEADGAKVIMTRTGDTYPTLEDRVKIALNNYAEVFVSIHVNSASNESAKGTETYYSVAGNVNIEEDETLAKAINDQIVKNADMKDRGVKKQDYYVIRNMILPSVLVELGFITNPEDRAKLTDHEYVEIFGDSIYKGIVEYYQK